MQSIVNEKKQYISLLILSVVLSLLLPLIITMLNMRYLNSTAIIISAASGAVLIFAWVRYRFKLCLPFAAVAIFLTLSANLVSILTSQIQLSSGILINILISTTLNCAIVFVNIGVAKAFAGVIKGKIKAALVIILSINVLNVILQIITLMINYFLNFQVLQATSINLTNIVFNRIVRMLIPSLLNCVLSFAVYLVLLGIYEEPDKFNSALKKAKMLIKKLWDTTAN